MASVQLGLMKDTKRWWLTDRWRKSFMLCRKMTHHKTLPALPPDKGGCWWSDTFVILLAHICSPLTPSVFFNHAVSPSSLAKRQHLLSLNPDSSVSVWGCATCLRWHHCNLEASEMSSLLWVFSVCGKPLIVQHRTLLSTTSIHKMDHKVHLCSMSYWSWVMT